MTTSEGTDSEKGTTLKQPNPKKKETFDMAAHVRGGHADHRPVSVQLYKAKAMAKGMAWLAMAMVFNKIYSEPWPYVQWVTLTH